MFAWRGAALAVFLVGSVVTASAEPMHGIAMHGAPKYPAGFEHLDYVNPDAPKGGSLGRGLQGTFDSLNPYILKGTPAAGRHHVFESLLKRVWDEPFTLYGLIAETVETPDDRSWVEFTLRPEARFHDGTPITIDDVIFSHETLRDRGQANMQLFYRKVTRVERVGTRGVRFAFDPDQADRELPLLMGLMPILSKAYYATRPFDESTLEPPLGSGPYRVAAVDPGRRIRYERVADYWGKDLAVNRGQDNFDVVEYEYFRDGNVLFEAFKTGAFDFRAEGSATQWATAYDFPAVKDGRVKREEIANGRPAGMRALVFNTRRDLFADPRVREALGYAFDFEWINANLLHGAFERTTSFFANSDLAATGPPTPAELALLEPWRGQVPAAVFAAPQQLPRSDGTGNNRANLRTARQLLQDAGWVVRDGAMVRASDGTPFAFEILLVFPEDERIALTFVRNLERLGIKVSVRTVDTAQYEFRRQTYDYDMIVHTWRITLSPGNEQAHYWGTAAADQEGTRNYIGVKSAAVDAMIYQVTASRDRAQLVSAMRALDRVLLAGHYVIPLYHQRGDRLAYWDKFARPQTIPTYGFVLETWWAKDAAN
ncbi:MAG: extracellular solute-binding protein [Alphaproteobacteria bacterium]